MTENIGLTEHGGLSGIIDKGLLLSVQIACGKNTGRLFILYGVKF